MKDDPVLSVEPLGFPWKTDDPFLFCVHHNDAYPAGNERHGPAASLAGRDIGQDFSGKDGWSMYHGDVVPGFPQHPHRGFETVTIVRRGLIDHSDSLGAIARFGRGDTQWLTAGKGIVHSEMFPLLDRSAPNPAELFQIWLNLPGSDKLVDPYFTMFWNRDTPTIVARDDAGHTTTVTVVAGPLGEAKPLPPPPNSWAAKRDAHVAIWTIKMEPGARWTLPAAPTGLNRTLYFFAGHSLRVGGRGFDGHAAIKVRSDAEILLEAGTETAELLLLQGRPINEPVAQHGPFVMNTRDEIQQAFVDYQRTQFGGWPWPQNGPVHPANSPRFAKRGDSREEPGD